MIWHRLMVFFPSKRLSVKFVGYQRTNKDSTLTCTLNLTLFDNIQQRSEQNLWRQQERRYNLSLTIYVNLIPNGILHGVESHGDHGETYFELSFRTWSIVTYITFKVKLKNKKTISYSINKLFIVHFTVFTFENKERN